MEEKKKIGRPQRIANLRTWAVDPGDPNNNSTLAVISMCIKEDMDQTLEELAERVAKCKRRPVDECLAVLKELKEKGHLGYFIWDGKNGFYYKKWEEGKNEICTYKHTAVLGVLNHCKSNGLEYQQRKNDRS